MCNFLAPKDPFESIKTSFGPHRNFPKFYTASLESKLRHCDKYTSLREEKRGSWDSVNSSYSDISAVARDSFYDKSKMASCSYLVRI